MLLVDTSIWVEHLRTGTVGLTSLLEDGDVLCHPFVIGELACGNLKNRREILALLKELPLATQAEDDEVMTFIDNHALMGKGLGYIDMHLLLAAHMTRVPLWTLDKRLRDVAINLGLAP